MQAGNSFKNPNHRTDLEEGIITIFFYFNLFYFCAFFFWSGGGIGGVVGEGLFGSENSVSVSYKHSLCKRFWRVCQFQRFHLVSMITRQGPTFSIFM